MLRLIQEQVNRKNMWEHLSRILDSVDADFTGSNGEQYFHKTGVSHFEFAVSKASLLTHDYAKIEYVLEACKVFSYDYYDGFEYEVFSCGEDSWLVTIATNC